MGETVKDQVNEQLDTLDSARQRQVLEFARGLAVSDKTQGGERSCDSEPDLGESAEMRWLVENHPWLEGYRGEWLLIQGGGLAAHSADFSEIRRAIAVRDIKSPFVYYVPKPDESTFIAF